MPEFVPSLVCIRSWHIQGQLYLLHCENHWLIYVLWQKERILYVKTYMHFRLLVGRKPLDV